MTERKTFTIRPEFKADEEGLLLARFATLNVVDKDGDVTLPGAFGEQAVRMQPYGHDTASPSIGKGSIHEEADEAIAEMRINLKMQAGREVYESLKFDAADGKPLQEFSYTFDVGKWSHGQFEGHDVRFLESLRVHSVDPVFLGAGVETGTLSVKEEKPFANEHACRLREPGDFQDDSFRRISRSHEGKRYAVIMGRLKGQTTLTEQAFRYPKDTWTASEAGGHCRSHDGRFEPASGEAHSGETYVDHAEHVLADVQAFIARSGELAALREKDGRTLSDEHKTRLDTLLDGVKQIASDLDAFLVEPSTGKPASAINLRRMLAEVEMAEHEFATA